MASPRFLGIDFGTSGARACVIAGPGEVEELTRIAFPDLAPHELAPTWRNALLELIAGLPRGLRQHLAGLAVDATSGTLLACNEALYPLHPPLLYHDSRARDEAQAIARAAGPDHPAASPSSGLAKALWLTHEGGLSRPPLLLNQADWLTALLSDLPGVSDYHNALKLGFDPETVFWPEWVARLIDIDCLPNAVPPGSPIGCIARSRARALGLPLDLVIRAGTTDSIAAFLATGAGALGDAVTSLGSTLVLKLVSSRRIDAGRLGVYSHWHGRHWLVGGASNAGGAVLRQHFSDPQIAELSARIDPARDSGLDYYPLPAPGERFPVNDPDLPPRLSPRPAEDAHFLHGLLEGLARVEATGYRTLADLGAGTPARILSTGGGAGNPVFNDLRARLLGRPVAVAAQQEAAYGAARLARDGSMLFQGVRHG
ncbi:MAG: FGGY-family carbohydrate kinase [Pseudomonadota bacterium]